MRTQITKQHTDAVTVQPQTTFHKEDRRKNETSTKLRPAILVAMVITMALSAVAQKQVVGSPAPYQNPLQLALKEWYPANVSAVVELQAAPTYVVETSLSEPGSIVFDGANIWVEDIRTGGALIDQLQASDGKYVGSYFVGDDADPQAFDGVNIIAPDHNASSTKVFFVRAADGNVATCSLGSGVTFPDTAAFDGTNVWVSTNSGYVVKLLFNNATRSCVPTPCYSNSGTSRLYDLAYDGNNMWVTAVDSNEVIKLTSSCVATTYALPAGSGPIGIVFDGTYLWTANDLGHSVSQITAATGTIAGPYALTYSPWWIAYDGANVWTTGPTAGMVSKMSTSNPSAPSYYQACGSAKSDPLELAFDGANMWVGCQGSNQLGKM